MFTLNLSCLECRNEFSVIVEDIYPCDDPTFTICGNCDTMVKLCGEDIEI